ncbi:MAG: hypothetical protein M3032_00705, partial [Verrucomicrobiota bacterium]|nr:hypothetical protein [Verrucomicrobiota bacterium]
MLDIFAALILSAPSIWLLATIPPLWRDVDAYNQVTVSPVRTTYLGHGPLYPFVARLPLWIGAQFEAIRSGSFHAFSADLMQPRLTDPGVFLLILLQQAAFVFASWLLIATISRRPLVRIALAVLWTGATAFYTLAHCVGSETLSLICTLLLAAAGLKLVRRSRAPVRAWKWFA